MFKAASFYKLYYPSLSITVVLAVVLWAQRSNEIYLTINLVDVEDAKLNVAKEKISFEGIGGTERKKYGFELDLCKEINPDTSKRHQTARQIVLVLDKAEHDQAYWPRLQKDKVKPRFLKTDFQKWKDENDDEDDDNVNPVGGMDFSSLMGGGMGGGMGGMSDDDSDEEMPDLEAVPKTDTDSMKVEEIKEEAKEEEKEEVKAST
ncbi:9840_t:CDS:2 [Paraglomus brasilianum]|uniref:9840_t:CDS:1 n=1 Tax=Paraglomus brasilianum TaxID=144538 RepID=A0A9N9BTA2_9GLOM|nr:9840_t:CDS:2 [Paraglomus brasilianum]